MSNNGQLYLDVQFFRRQDHRQCSQHVLSCHQQVILFIVSSPLYQCASTWCCHPPWAHACELTTKVQIWLKHLLSDRDRSFFRIFFVLIHSGWDWKRIFCVVWPDGKSPTLSLFSHVLDRRISRDVWAVYPSNGQNKTDLITFVKHDVDKSLLWSAIGVFQQSIPIIQIAIKFWEIPTRYLSS